MRWRLVLQLIGVLIAVIGLAMSSAWGCAVLFGDRSRHALMIATLVTTFSGSVTYLFSRHAKSDVIGPREGMAIVSLGWLSAGLFGALPFFIYGAPPTFTDCLFESISGFTTTGSSVLTDIEILPQGLLFWRSLIQWLGGMGIIVLSVAILPYLGVGGLQLYKAEVPSPVPDKLRPRMQDTAKILWKVYIAISAAEAILLMFGGMTLFDSLCHTFTTMPTGGFSTRNTSIAAYDSLYIETVVVIFMFASGINFTLYYMGLKGNLRRFWKDSELRFFAATVLLLTFLIGLDLWRQGSGGFLHGLRQAAFQVVSIITTTGFVTADFEAWPAFSQAILFLCMFLGACAGSTGGGVKCLRVMLGFKYCYRELFTLLHPRSVSLVKIGGRPVPHDVMRGVLGFLFLYGGIYAICSTLLALLGTDFLTAFTATATAMGNVGPGLGSVGPVENFAHLPQAAKWLLMWCMLLGRLELFTVLVLLLPEYWRA